MITISSFKETLREISQKTGQRGNIEGVILRKENIYDLAVQYCEQKIKENKNPNREPYSIYTNNCIIFVEKLVRSLGFITPSLIKDIRKFMPVNAYFGTDKVPTLYIKQFQYFFSARDLFYYYLSNKLEVNF